MCGGLGKFAGIGVRPAKDVPRIFDDGGLHSQAQTQIWPIILAGILHCLELAFNAPVSEASGDENSVRLRQNAVDAGSVHAFGINPFDIHAGSQGIPGVAKGLRHGKVSVAELDIFPYQRDADGFLPAFDPVYQGLPLPEIRCGRVNFQLAADHGREILLLQHNRSLVKYWQSHVFNDAVGLDVAEIRNLRKNALVQNRLVAAQNNNVRADAAALQLLDGVLGRLRLVLAGGPQIRHQRHVDIK